MRKICIIIQLADQHKALVIILQEAHCTNGDQLVISHFTLAGWVSSRERFLRLSKRNLAGPLWINHQRNQQLSGCVWTLILARLSMSTNHQPCNLDKQPLQCSHTVFKQVILTVNTLTGAVIAPA